MRKSFTMIELVFVVVVIGILSAVILPRTDTNSLREAAIQLASDIRYTQHLAMIDDKYDANDASWYKARWQIVFRSGAVAGGTWSYSVYSDSPNYTGNADELEIAIDPSSPSKVLSGGSSSFHFDDAKANKKLNVGSSYGIGNVVMTGGCAGQSRLTFDYMGRPIEGTIHGTVNAYDKAKLLNTTCNIVLTGSDGSTAIIEIEPETGYVHIQ